MDLDYLQYIRDTRVVESNYLIYEDRLTGTLAIEAIAALKVLLNTAHWANYLRKALLEDVARPEAVKFANATPDMVAALTKELTPQLSQVTDRAHANKRMINSVLGMWAALAQLSIPLFEKLADGKEFDFEHLLFRSGDMKLFAAIMDDVITDALDIAPEAIFSANVIALKEKHPHLFKSEDTPHNLSGSDVKNGGSFAVDDKKIVYGVICTWWGTPSEASTQPNTNLPCCPHCRGLLATVEPDKWLATHEEHASALKDPDYLSYMQWLKTNGKCWTHKDGGHDRARKVFDRKQQSVRDNAAKN